MKIRLLAGEQNGKSKFSNFELKYLDPKMKV